MLGRIKYLPRFLFFRCKKRDFKSQFQCVYVQHKSEIFHHVVFFFMLLRSFVGHFVYFDIERRSKRHLSNKRFFWCCYMIHTSDAEALIPRLLPTWHNRRRIFFLIHHLSLPCYFKSLDCLFSNLVENKHFLKFTSEKNITQHIT